MPRLNETRYHRQLSVAMAVYIAAMLLVWPLARTAASMPLKMVLAVVPVLPMLAAIGLMARRIAASDEFEQRVHLLALGASTALLGALSLVGGFLAAAGVLALDGSILIWVFPVTMLGYVAGRWWLLVRHYGSSEACEEYGSLNRRLLLLAGVSLMVVVAAWWRDRLDDFQAGLLCGVPGMLLLLALVLWRRRARRVAHER